MFVIFAQPYQKKNIHVSMSKKGNNLLLEILNLKMTL